MGNKIMKRRNSNVFSKEKLSQQNSIKNFKLRFVIHFCLSIFSTFIVWIRGGTGLGFHFFIVRKAFKAFFSKRISFQELYNFVVFPLDSFRYFEFHYGSKFIQNIPKQSFLDISSPRFFPAFLVENDSIKNAQLLNPDVNDIQQTQKIFEMLQLCKDANLINKLIQDASFSDSSFDLVTSISVLEHIPLEYIDGILDSIVQIVKPNGHVLISVPIAKESFDEYIDYNEYGLQEESSDGFYFGQRFHDDSLIKKTFYSKLGEPVAFKLVSENIEDFFFNDRFQKLNDVNYSKWNEALRFANNYKEIRSFNELSGIGVGVFLFQIKK